MNFTTYLEKLETLIREARCDTRDLYEDLYEEWECDETPTLEFQVNAIAQLDEQITHLLNDIEGVQSEWKRREAGHK